MIWNEQDDRQATSGESPEMQAAITRALEAQPAVHVPTDFAARMRTMLPPPTPARKPQSSALRVGVVAVVVLLVAAFWLAPHSAPRLDSVAFDFELGLIVELAGVTAWLASTRRGV
jgi:hypothetical protein